MALPLEKQELLIKRAMEIAAEAAERGDRPFAGILADENGSIVIECGNTVNSTNNAAAHAEINLLYVAGEKIKKRDLSSYLFISNAAPCPMCATALIKARITRFYFGATNEVTMVPNITMDEVFTKVPYEIEVHGGILGQECAQQISELSSI